MRLVVVGDALLDRDLDGDVDRLCPEAPVPVLADPVEAKRPGGAALAATLAALDGCDVTLLAPLADDAAGQELRRLLELAGVEVAALAQSAPTPEKVRLRARGQLLLRVDYGDERLPAPEYDLERARSALAGADAVLLSDYGRGFTADTRIRDLLTEAATRVPLVWDPHPRGAVPVEGAALVTPNAAEAAAQVLTVRGDDIAAVEARATALLARWRASAVAVTLGARGAIAVSEDGTAYVATAAKIDHGDPCGAGDRFAAAAAEALGRGSSLGEALSGAVSMATAFVAAGGAAQVRLADVAPAKAVEPRDDDWAAVLDAVARVRLRGGTVVATGGCFDLLHAGHVSTLEAAKKLGDYLVVLLNSDESVTRQKGPGRPLVGEQDRAALLRALSCVDAVLVFGEDTAARALGRLRPDIFAKGGDYAGASLPEAPVLEEWGGRLLILPYVEGHSTTELIAGASRRAR